MTGKATGTLSNVIISSNSTVMNVTYSLKGKQVTQPITGSKSTYADGQKISILYNPTSGVDLGQLVVYFNSLLLLMKSVLLIIPLIILLLFGLYYQNKQTLTKVVVINLDKNPDRLMDVEQQYAASDVKLPLERFSAIVGNQVNPVEWLSSETISELTQIEQQGFRTKHHQLTRGAIGCYISHMKVISRIKPGEVYLVLEDDILIRPKSMDVIKNMAPRDWDMILLGYNSYRGTNIKNGLVDVKSFWGTCGYLINYKGAQKFLKESGDTFDCQIDTFMSWMVAHNMLKVYALQKPIIRPHGKFASDIQFPIKILGVESHQYRDKILQL